MAKEWCFLPKNLLVFKMNVENWRSKSAKKVILFSLWSLLGFSMTTAQNLDNRLRIEPPNWWVGFKMQSLQLLLYGSDIGSYVPSLEYPGVNLSGWHKADNLNYLFLDLEIDPKANPGNLQIQLTHAVKPGLEISYVLKARSGQASDFVGFDASDVVYLITPDRFANGDPSNDVVKGMREQTIDRTNNYARHGGDIQGIIQHLDYVEEMGFTAIWPSPLLTNDMQQQSYHGYAITDYYEVDPRFGTLDDYKELTTEARKKGIKIIMDQVVNHCGLEHWWIQDLPFSNWIHYQQEYLSGNSFTGTNHRRTVNQDPYAAQADKTIMNRGWFVPSMPDLNHSNPFMATYLIQNSIWWIETLGLGGIRQDTYPYPEKGFMARWAGTIMKEYPEFTIVGEEWSYNPLLVGYWQDGAQNKDGYRSNLKSTMDFPLQKALVDALKSEESWGTGLVMLYEGLSNDFHYTRPQDIMLFGDNHDMDRLYTQLNEDKVLTEMALAFILMAPRIPQIYYGTEILMQNTSKPGDHGLIRTDFPGGWAGDTKNAFGRKGLSKAELETQQKLRRLLRFRKNSTVLHKGKTVHFAPEKGIYLLARSLGSETVVLVLNKNEEPVSLELSRFSELQLTNRKLTEVVSGDEVNWNEKLSLNRKGAYIFTTSQ